MEKLPYVISAELDLNTQNMQAYIKQTELDKFREDLDADLRKIGKETCWVSSSEMAAALNRATQNTCLPIISLDDRYLTSADQYLGISRSIDTNLSDAGYTARQNYSSLTSQLERATTLGREVMLVDDVLFSGEMITWLNNTLTESGVTIGSIAVGIAMQEGIDKLLAQGIDVSAGRVFSAVEDEICERDLAVVSGSGRRIEELETNALYFDTENGNPELWASIGRETSKAFCISSLERSRRLLQPDAPMQSIGKFLGYSSEGSVANALTTRLGEMQ